MLIMNDTLEKKCSYNCEMDVTPFLQPVINTYDNCIVGAEILCRVKQKKDTYLISCISKNLRCLSVQIFMQESFY